MAPKLHLAAAIAVLAVVGCAPLAQITGSTWHKKCGWKAEDYFDDPQVVALCRAIEANDIAEIDRLIAAGANVNAQGKGRMTPLLWAYPDNKLERFKRLLEHGADPNIIFESDFNTHGGISCGDSITHMACKTAFPGYFEAVFEHGGDPTLQRTSVVGANDTPLFSVIKFGGANKQKKIQLLIDKGVDINYQNATGTTATRQAVGWGGQYDIALMLLEAGADHRIYAPSDNSKLIHRVIEEESRLPQCTPEQKADYQKLLQWLVDHGESVDEARADMKRWKSWSLTTGAYRRKMAAEVAERKKREAREKAAAAKEAEPK